jgi:multiple antibiotic resistance protein
MCCCSLGDTVFSEIMQVEFASFQIFGGIIFLLIGLQLVFRGPQAIKILRGESEHLAGAIAMPVLIGPGTISVSVIIGKRLDPLMAGISIFSAISISIVIILLLKFLHDIVRTRQERLIQRYIEIAGRITALYVGTVSIEMIMQGIRTWADKF